MQQKNIPVNKISTAFFDFGMRLDTVFDNLYLFFFKRKTGCKERHKV